MECATNATNVRGDYANSSSTTMATAMAENGVKEDYFGQLYSSSALKTAAIIAFTLGFVIGLFSSIGIIWYDRHGSYRQYRTVINQLFATFAWYVLAYLILIYLPEAFRYFGIGPRNTTYCHIHHMARNFIVAGAYLTMTAIILLRYLFIFKLSNFAGIKEDLIATVTTFRQTTTHC